jgi:uncharacterized short protein YbdD (DUF466 family)
LHDNGRRLRHDRSGNHYEVRVFKFVSVHLSRIWRLMRALCGEDQYERYLGHWYRHHSTAGLPLSRKAFFQEQTERKWNGVKRCC